MTLQRVFINKAPPKQKTIFLIRHGESKWNKAQASVDIGGLLDLDHALSERGVQQAIDLNDRWRAAVRTQALKDNVNIQPVSHLATHGKSKSVYSDR